MVLETGADSEHQKKSVNLGLRTKSWSRPSVTADGGWFHTEKRWSVLHGFLSLDNEVHFPPQEHWFQMVLDGWQYSKPPSETSFQGGHFWKKGKKICKRSKKIKWRKKKGIRKYKTSQHNCKGIAPKIPTALIFKYSFQRRIMKQKFSVTFISYGTFNS